MDQLDSFDRLVNLAKSMGIQVDLMDMDKLYKLYIHKLQTELYTPTHLLMLDTIEEVKNNPNWVSSFDS